MRVNVRDKAELALRKARAARTYFRRRHRDYAVTFQSENAPAQRVLADLRGVCVGPLGNENPFEMARAVGRREVWDHIQEVLGYNEKQVHQLVSAEREQREREFASA
jgi:hypothetical protein